MFPVANHRVGEGMKSIKHVHYFLAAMMLAALSPLANSAPAVCGQLSHNGYTGEFDGRFYQVVVADGISWDAAKTARRMHIDPITWTPEGPKVNGPSTGEQSF